MGKKDFIWIGEMEELSPETIKKLMDVDNKCVHIISTRTRTSHWFQEAYNKIARTRKVYRCT